MQADNKRAAKDFIQHITDLTARLGIPLFSHLNSDPDTFEKIAQMSYENNSAPSNPRVLTREDYIRILENAYG